MLCIGLVISVMSFGQTISNIEWSKNNMLHINKIIENTGSYEIGNRPLVYFEMNGEPINELAGEKISTDSGTILKTSKLNIEVMPQPSMFGEWRAKIIFTNITSDTLSIDNVLPLGKDEKLPYITGGEGNWVNRTKLFRPGLAPLSVILPDNAWESGISFIPSKDDNSYVALTRRGGSNKNSKSSRFETTLYPQGEVYFTIYIEKYKGIWQIGLKKILQDRKLYDVEVFDNTLFEREDLKWARHSYLSQLMMAWDHNIFDSENNYKYTLPEFIKFNNKNFGGADIYALWPNWPMLGMDQRNQWDMFKAMPGGMDSLRMLANVCHENNAHLLISFKPWDQSTRKEDPYIGLSEVILGVNADGVVLDCSGASSKQLRTAGDVKDGVIMYSEGMAVPKDMQGIVSGRVHNALYYCPPLNLNKIIKPDFSIFRVVEIGKEPVRREYALSLFNGYGIENNLFSPGRPHWLNKQWAYLGRVLMALRNNSFNFTSFNITPLVPTLIDKIYVNKWMTDKKTVYTIFSLIPEGVNDPLFEVSVQEGSHFINLWIHEDVKIDSINEKKYAVADVDGFHKKYVGSNNEGGVAVIAQFPKLLKVNFNIPDDQLDFSAGEGKYIRVWAGNPTYTNKEYHDFAVKENSIKLYDFFGRFESKFVIQLFDGSDQLLDEQIIEFTPASARRISNIAPSESYKKAPKGMVKVPAGKFVFTKDDGDVFIPYPDALQKGEIYMPEYFMDKYPVTNKEYKEFLSETNYIPSDSENYLKHWQNGTYKQEDADKPVIFVSYEDAGAYAKWAGKRIPTELEWQYAAQTSEGWIWPWSKENNVVTKNWFSTQTLNAKQYSGFDSTLCNPGNGIYEEVGKYPNGANPLGIEDLVGSVWQITNDIYENGTYSFIIVKGGSYFKAESSWWYVPGGPQKLNKRQMILRVSQGFERNATTGFRCVADKTITVEQ